MRLFQTIENYLKKGFKENELKDKLIYNLKKYLRGVRVSLLRTIVNFVFQDSITSFTLLPKLKNGDGIKMGDGLGDGFEITFFFTYTIYIHQSINNK